MKLNTKLLCLVLPILIFNSISSAKMNGDNTKINTRDTSVKELTADQQKMNMSDTKMTALIRSKIMKEEKISTYAQNIKIITVNGKVTLKGPVYSSAEEKSILESAYSVAGKPNVINEIALMGQKSN